MQLESILGINLNARKKEIDDLVMDYVNSHNKDESEDEEEEASDSESDPEPEPKRKRKASSDEEESRPQKTRNSRNRGSDDDSRKKPKKARKSAGAAAGGGGKARGTGFTRPYQLSPALASLMGTDSCPRHEVVKKMWAIIKERNLYDPKNKQYAICDGDLQKVMGVKRFRTFGMLKYLKPHFID